MHPDISHYQWRIEVSEHFSDGMKVGDIVVRFSPTVKAFIYTNETEGIVNKVVVAADHDGMKTITDDLAYMLRNNKPALDSVTAFIRRHTESLGQ